MAGADGMLLVDWLADGCFRSIFFIFLENNGFFFSYSFLLLAIEV